MNFPTNVEFVLKELNKFGYEAYVVGGAVRDYYMGLEPNDYDITTNATPDEVESIFDKTIPTGKEYGTISVDVDGEIFEVTTYRLDLDNDGRRPNVVKFAKTLEDDLKRRDFTINAMAIDLDGNLIDLFGGIKDINLKLIRFVGEAEDRINEDKLRILRAVRFASRFNFEIDAFSLVTGVDISNISQERMTSEFNKIISCKNPSYYIGLLNDLGLLWQIMPELYECLGFKQNNPCHDKDVFYHTMTVVDNVRNDYRMRLSALLHDISKPKMYTVDECGVGHFYEHHKESYGMCKDIMKRMKYSNDDIDFVSNLVLNHMSKYGTIKLKTARKLINRVGEDMIFNLFELQVADILGCVKPFNFYSVYKMRFMCESILENRKNEALTLKDLKVNGNDLIRLGFKGKDIGIVLNELLEHVLEFENDNTKEKLIKISLNFKNSY